MAALFLRKTLFSSQLRTLHRSAVAFSVPLTFNSHKNKEKFQEVYPEVLDSLMTSPKLANQLPEVGSRIRQLMDYTMLGGKLAKGLAVPFAYQMVEDPNNFTEEKLHTARFLGWCFEIVQGKIIIADDIIDGSTTRRGKPCWYLQPNVGTSAINDCILIYHCLMEILEINFGNETFYASLIKRISEAYLYTMIGQYLDISSGYTKEKNNLDLFTMERYNATARQKAGHFAYSFPFQLALVLIKNGNEKYTTELGSICWDMGILLQSENDYKDVYCGEATTGKAGTDIQEGKLTWFAVTALERCNEAQRSIFKEYYGSKDPEHVKRIKQLYEEMQMDKLYEKFESSIYESLKRRICELPTEGETRFFLEVMEAGRNKIY